ncbi:MAG: 1-(5-phosphoribosyl)-5-[(5-phosphoribosylamino)methylideneamino]imidazole-4-carboxamide isomerase [Clostridiales bacterium]|nr:1-(5-phosphoribosyl)-5-[(5-phosphoribosylamino)methylideneamino]imidazole-4-carboxamide isomerase [Clostridiales bacterium]
MIIYPAIDLVGGKAVRLYKGDYDRMTVYKDDPPAVAKDFRAAGAERIHVVDLEGARDGGTPNYDTVCAIKNESGLFTEIGGGIRSMDTVSRYLSAGIDRVILGTAAVKDQDFLREAVGKYGEKIAVGIDVRDGIVAIKGWTELSEYGLEEFCKMMQDIGVRTIICTDISRDGAMKGTNHELYRKLSEELDMDLVASGGVSSLEDVKRLADLGIHGAIIGKAYYTGAIDLADAVKIGKAK